MTFSHFLIEPSDQFHQTDIFSPISYVVSIAFIKCPQTTKHNSSDQWRPFINPSVPRCKSGLFPFPAVNSVHPRGMHRFCYFFPAWGSSAFPIRFPHQGSWTCLAEWQVAEGLGVSKREVGVTEWTKAWSGWKDERSVVSQLPACSGSGKTSALVFPAFQLPDTLEPLGHREAPFRATAAPTQHALACSPALPNPSCLPGWFYLLSHDSGVNALYHHGLFGPDALWSSIVSVENSWSGSKWLKLLSICSFQDLQDTQFCWGRGVNEKNRVILRGHVPSRLDLLFLGSSRYFSSSGSTFSVLSMTGNRVFYHYRL